MVHTDRHTIILNDILDIANAFIHAFGMSLIVSFKWINFVFDKSDDLLANVK